ncbi:CsbD family protein [Methylobacterium mesophilicum SR1.6/6]|uniref:CsbD family protein n=1 Tax=Methylobacterium mesophilicum SR1.6/6 TaxID=908290 RepID=A0A6B9FN51_9HYPH|nr:CsbD family protein [Methylobacterium mesophilicum]QGY02388.1 CsbD family protein [Methylobacterium mesophilicum SR1.6/6]
MVDTDRITGAARELGGKVQGAVGDLTGSKRDSLEGRAREAAGQAENLYGRAKDTVRDTGDRIRDAAGDVIGSGDIEDRYVRAERSVRRAADEAYDYAEDAYERGGHYLRRGTREVSHQVAEYPLASLLIAGLAGFGLGLLVSAKRD